MKGMIGKNTVAICESCRKKQQSIKNLILKLFKHYKSSNEIIIFMYTALATVSFSQFKDELELRQFLNKLVQTVDLIYIKTSNAEYSIPVYKYKSYNFDNNKLRIKFTDEKEITINLK